jgi:Cft2 family RNA processing exonuclease
MKITFLGGADEVGASGILIELAGRRILVDSGIRPSPKARYGLAGDQLPDLSLLDQAGGLDAILVTHAHTDHTGALELVVGRYPGVPVYATPPTAALARVLHQDARRIMQTRLEEEGELPLFDDLAVSRLVEAFVQVPFHERQALGAGLAATFYPAGHIAGAAMIGLESDEGRVLISGDVSFTPQRTVGGARLPAFEPDILVLESTYGGRLHANRAVQERRLVETVREVSGAGGKVLVPAFALGRAQEILLILSEFQRRGELPPVPVWADGMVRAVCQVYASFPGYLPLPLQEQGAEFFQGSIRPVRGGEQRTALVWQADPAVIVSSSGMLAGGPSMAYARALAGQPQHAILLTGYQDEESPGRRLQEMAGRGRGALYLGKDKVDVQCRLGTYSLSAHADEAQLISMVETLNPAHVLLVHGDEAARASLSTALQARKRHVWLPRAGQSLEFSFAAETRQPARGIGQGLPPDARLLWQGAAAEAGGYFQLGELAQAWWGRAAGAAEEAALEKALLADDLYFAPDPRRPGIFRARPAAQVEVTVERRERMAGLRDLPGQWLALRGTGGSARLARCTSTAQDHFWVEDEEGEAARAWPEDLLAVYGSERPAADQAQAAGGGLGRTVMEPNQALAAAAGRFPPEARLRKTGYRLDQRVLLLTFEFPDRARERYGEQIEQLEQQTGWTVELAPEANQNALFLLAQDVLPPGWRIVKGPALHRQERQVSITAAGPSEDMADLEQAASNFLAESGFSLAITPAAEPPRPAPGPLKGAAAGKPWEINAAYNAIKGGLEGTSLYKTSLKGSEIVLSFISPQVGRRYQERVDVLAKQVGWPLAINPQANQGAIQEAAQALLRRAGLAIVKGPGIYPDKAEVTVTVAGELEEDREAELEAEFEDLTGFRLALQPQAAAPSKRLPAEPAASVVTIPLARVRLRRFHRELELDPAKVEKAAERARRLGQITPPVQVRRTEDGYLLVDGLYRLRAAEKLGLDEIPAVIE